MPPNDHMVVRVDVMIDLPQPHVSCDFTIGAGIAPAGIPGINQDGFLFWGNDQSRAATFGIDPVNLQRQLGRCGDTTAKQEG